MRRLRLGIVGYGYWGSKHVRVARSLPDVELVIIEQHLDRMAAAAEAFPDVEIVVDLDQVIADLDAVIIATAPTSHGHLARRFLESGVHVLVEKPLATTTAEGMELVQIAEANDLVLMVGHTFEYNPSVQMLREMILNGDLGELRYIDTARLNLGMYQSDVNVIWDLAPHDISITNYLLDSQADHVSAWARSNVISQTEDVAYLQLEYTEPSINSYINVSWLNPQKVRRVTVVGSEKMVIYNDVDVNEPIRVYDMGIDLGEESVTPERPVIYRYGDIWSPRVNGREPLLVEDEHFIECIRTGERPQSDGLSGLTVVNTIETAVQSCLGGGIRLPIPRAGAEPLQGVLAMP